MIKLDRAEIRVGEVVHEAEDVWVEVVQPLPAHSTGIGGEWRGPTLGHWSLSWLAPEGPLLEDPTSERYRLELLAPSLRLSGTVIITAWPAREPYQREVRFEAQGHGPVELSNGKGGAHEA